MQGSTVMRQSGAETLVTEEPYAFIAHVRVCGGAGRETAGSTRKLTASSSSSCLAFGSGPANGGEVVSEGLPRLYNTCAARRSPVSRRYGVVEDDASHVF